MGRHRVSWSRARSGQHRHNLEDFLGTLWLEAGFEQISGGLPHPTFLCWFMGFPSSWLDAALSAMHSTRTSRSSSASSSSPTTSEKG
jgi:hypothetical protein